MSIIKFPYFVYLNIALALILIVAPFIIESGFNSTAFGIAIFGIIQITIALLTKENLIPSLPKLINPKFFALSIFLLSVFLNFIPYILDFTDNINLSWVVLGCAGISLFSILFTDFNFLENK